MITKIVRSQIFIIKTRCDIILVITFDGEGTEFCNVDKIIAINFELKLKFRRIYLKNITLFYLKCHNFVIGTAIEYIYGVKQNIIY